MATAKRNFVYNLIYQIIILIIPLIVTPYLTRILGASGVGIYSYTHSIVYYFMLVALLGINNYGNREIAKCNNNIEQLKKKFWSIYSIEFIGSIIMILLYIGYIVVFLKEYQEIALIQTILLISNMFDINWYFFGREKFKLTVTRNSIIKILTTIMIFSLVREVSDVWKYTLIMSGMTLISQIFLWPTLLKEIGLYKPTFSEMNKHLKPCLTLFIPVIAISIYKIMDKIMIGAMIDSNEVGYYDSGEKIVSVCFTVINALGTVMLPRISNLMSQGKSNEANRYISKSLAFTMFIAFAMSFGLISVGYNFAPLYFGNGFEKSGIIICMLGITVPIVSWATVIRTQYLIPKEKDKTYIISVILGALVNIILNLIFIQKYGSIGACIGTIAAETVVMLYQTISIRNEVPIKEYLKSILPFFFKGLVMFGIIILFNDLNINNFVKIIIQVSIGVIVYSLLNIKYILSIINIKKYKISVISTK